MNDLDSWLYDAIRDTFSLESLKDGATQEFIVDVLDSSCERADWKELPRKVQNRLVGAKLRSLNKKGIIIASEALYFIRDRKAYIPNPGKKG